ncbi:type III secretion system translocon subunit SctE [Aeromonas schubertii]|uniref:type III secretion system translocon subunit SctE n=1 Tax=Aeromonas schubertii TaxID=652 RepID=UPI001CC438CB|nr:type III secretion system translocon subunit SctE [Aeromonas schubertii]MBZ6074320.1 type III secretion system translocon subunit SctE [Aeromonas schubertii]
MNPIINDRSLLVGGMHIPLVDSEGKSVAQATQVAAGDVVGKGEGRVKGVELPQPKPGVSQQVTAQQQQELGQLMKTVQQGAANSAKLIANTSLLANLAFTSPDEFEIELGKMTSELEKTQKKLKLADIERARQQNMKKIDENQAKIKEAEEAAEKAKKSGLASKIFGWISAIASIVIGAIMVATGVGAAAGALMIAAGTVGVVNMAVQQAAEDGLISKEVMEKLGPVLMAVEIALAIASAVVTFGAGAVKGIAKLGVKIGFKMAGKGASEAGLKLIQNSAKLYMKAADVSAKLGSNAASTTAKAVKFGTGAADLVLDVSNGVTKTVDSANQASLQNKQADLVENRQAMTALQGALDKLKEALSQMTEAFQQVMEMIFQMITAKGAMLNNLASRPAAI